MNRSETSPSEKPVSPRAEADWEKYFDLRWRVLRAPWGQQRGSEKDEREADSRHFMIIGPGEEALAVGRLHFNSRDEAQVRFMAVTPEMRGRGLGSAILRACEDAARTAGAGSIVLNAREDVVPFYARHGFVSIGPAETLFGVVRHVRMRKDLCVRPSERQHT